jgi:carboxyl-terminal processing protease
MSFSSFRRRRLSPVRVAATIVAALVLLAIGMFLGGHPSWMPSGLRSAFVNDSGSRLMQDVVSLLQRDYYRPVNPNQLVNQGIAGAVASLNDPYSHYFDPGDYRSFENQSNPHLSGIGVDVLPDPKGLKIVGVFPGSPAARAGLVEGDLIVKVGSRSLAGHTATFASNLIRGPAGTSVTLTIVRAGKSHRVTLKRANIVVPVASGRIVTYHGIKLGYVQLTSFTEGAGAEVRSQVQRVLRAGARGLILDLRENGGGLLDQAVAVASTFIPDGTIVSTDGRAQPREVYLAKGNAIAAHQPMVVLVDRGTASAAEIVTAALQDRHRALVVGTRTYGKGVFQEIEPLPNGGALDFTVGEYFTPNGTNLGGGGVRRGRGVQPNVYALDNPHTSTDEALQTAERVVASKVR